jgi:CRISPR system Cascade subunit CasD
MGKYLVFHLYGPMVSFGDTAVGEYRPTFTYPSKSSILGLVAAALGVRRDEEERIQELNRNIGFGVLVLSPGTLLRDYHTAQVPSASSEKHYPMQTRKDELSVHNLNTILSSRDYRMDALYRVVLWTTGKNVDLDTINTALREPYFTPYLGRKSCPPSIPFEPVILEKGSAREALTSINHSLQEVLAQILDPYNTEGYKKNDYLVYQDLEKESDGQQKVFRKDRLINRKNWQFGDREELMTTVGGPDVFQQS